MDDEIKFVIRCRAVIIYNGKLLTVRHVGKNFLALPGGHLEFGEDPKECVSREVLEELGIEPVIGSLLCVNTFLDGVTCQPVEFFFEIKNAMDYLKIEDLHKSHAFEIEEYVWVSPEDDVLIKPIKFADLFRRGDLLTNEIAFIKC